MTRARAWAPGAVIAAAFAALWLHGATLGPSDDEAYYWVLAQRPALGYAFHPPAVAWVLALFQRVFGWLLGAHSTAMLRLPAAALSAAMLFVVARWLRAAGAAPGRVAGALGLLITFAGFFALSWMWVPDLPLYAGITLAFVSVWRLCFGRRTSGWAYAGAAVGTALAALSKYSAVLAVASSVAALLLWAPRGRKGRAIALIGCAFVAANVPALVWNSRHEWLSILYQVRDRHGAGEFSLARFGEFWLVEVALAGPLLVFYSLRSMVRPRGRTETYAAVWAAPAALVFFFQPLLSSFKPHWAFAAWWPMALGLARAWACEPKRLPRWLLWPQVAWGAIFIAFVALACQLPLVAWATGSRLDPRLDVTNDLYGWRQLPLFLARRPEARWPVVGSRYQTAAQAAFALGDSARVTMIPRDLKERDEWPMLDATNGYGPGWPRLLKPVLYVADERYSAPPGFGGSFCEPIGQIAATRLGAVAKQITVWKCAPRASRP